MMNVGCGLDDIEFLHPKSSAGNQLCSRVLVLCIFHSSYPILGIPGVLLRVAVFGVIGVALKRSCPSISCGKGSLDTHSKFGSFICKCPKKMYM